MNEKELEIAENIKGMLSKNLRIPEEELDYEVPLFGDGIGLDSVDSLDYRLYRFCLRRSYDRCCKGALLQHREPYKVRCSKYVIASHTKRAVPKGNFGAALCILNR